MIEIRTVQESDLPAFHRLHNRDVDRDDSLDTVREWYDDHPDLLLVADDRSPVGHALGRPRSDTEVELAGISVVEDRRREGLGSKLFDAFEDRAASRGFERVSLGSAGGYVDDFYVANGYSPESVLVRLDADDTPPETTHEVIDEQVEGDTWKLYVAPETETRPTSSPFARRSTTRRPSTSWPPNSATPSR